MIYGERIRFRGVERDDISKFAAWLNDPEVRKGLAMHMPMSSADEESWFEDMLKRPVDEHVLGIEVRQPSTEGGEERWKLIGNCAFFNLEWRNRASEFGILIGDKAYWSQGYGTEAVRLLLRHGFETLNLNRIFLRVFENNPRAIRAYEKAGFVLEGRQRQAEFMDGKYIDVLVMSILKGEF